MASDLEALLDLAVRGYVGPRPWDAGLLVPNWDGTFTQDRAPLSQPSLAAAVRDHAARFGAQPSFDFAWTAMTGRAPWKFPLPLEPQMDELKERCDAGELIVGLARPPVPRAFRFAAFAEVYEVTLELPDERRAQQAWREFAASVELLSIVSGPR